MIRVTREAFRERTSPDTAVSRALLRQVARGDEPDTLRIYTPADVVAFGAQDTRAEIRRCRRVCAMLCGHFVICIRHSRVESAFVQTGENTALTNSANDTITAIF